MDGLAIIKQTDQATIRGIVDMVLDGLNSDHSKRSYEKALEDFLYWWAGEGKPVLSKAVIQRYKTLLLDKGLSAGTINLKLAAIRKLMAEAADNGLVDPVQAAGITKIKGVRSAGIRSGNWLNRSQAQALINAPDITRLKGLRDRAILAVMIGSGLRRSEVANLTFEYIRLREGRWVIVDLMGKGNRVRSVPIPSWAKVAIDDWAEEACLCTGRVFLPVHKGGYLNGENITPQTVYDVVNLYARELGLEIAAHDLRRTYAKLARKGGAELTQIQITLGHANVATTQRYIGEELNLQDAPCDKLQLSL